MVGVMQMNRRSFVAGVIAMPFVPRANAVGTLKVGGETVPLRSLTLNISAYMDSTAEVFEAMAKAGRDISIFWETLADLTCAELLGPSDWPEISGSEMAMWEPPAHHILTPPPKYALGVDTVRPPYRGRPPEPVPLGRGKKPGQRTGESAVAHQQAMGSAKSVEPANAQSMSNTGPGTTPPKAIAP